MTGATIWWDVFGQRLLLAFNKERINQLQWDVDVGLGGCGARLPSALEDRMPTVLINKILQSFSEHPPPPPHHH